MEARSMNAYIVYLTKDQALDERGTIFQIVENFRPKCHDETRRLTSRGRGCGRNLCSSGSSRYYIMPVSRGRTMACYYEAEACLFIRRIEKGRGMLTEKCINVQIERRH